MNEPVRPELSAQEEQQPLGGTPSEEAQQKTESTIFSSPVAHTDKKAGKHVLLTRILAALLAVAVLAGGAAAIVRFLPEKTEDETPSKQAYQIYSCVETSISTITIRYGGETMVLRGALQEKDGGADYVWALDGYDPSLIDATALSTIAGNTAAMNADGEYELTELSLFGLDNPVVTVEVKGETSGDFTLSFGATTANGAYYYMMATQLPGKAYLIPSSTVSAFMTSPLSLAITSAIPAVSRTDANASFFNSEGKLESFDSLVISGNRFPEPITIVPNKDDRYSTYANYLTTTPKMRIAAGAEDLLKIFAEGLSASQSVCFDQSAESLHNFGLDDPDWVITLHLGNETHTYRFKAIDKVTYYVAGSTDAMIRVATTGTVSFLAKSEKDFYTLFMVLESISDVSNLSLSGEVNASFDISHDDTEDVYHVRQGDREVNADSFQSSYAALIGTSATDIATMATSDAPSLTLSLAHHDGSPATVLTFVKTGETRYQYTVGGVPMGQITSSAYKTIVRNFSSLAQ